MKMLYPGCRARIKYMRLPEWQHLTGREVTIVSRPNEFESVLRLFLQEFPCDWVCDIDGEYRPGFFLADQLEPIIPDMDMEETEEELEECA